MIARELSHILPPLMDKGKAIVLLGPRQVGKTTLLQHLLKQHSGQVLSFTGDDITTRELFSQNKLEVLKQIVGNAQWVFIDEAQRIPQIGLSAKLIVDHIPQVQLVLSGSSSFELTQHVHEPLTGRKWAYNLWPISWKEWQNHLGYLKAEQDIENRLVLGFYPEVLNQQDNARQTLNELVDSYLFKDVLQYSGIRKADVIMKLVTALAYQVGSEVVFSEMAKTVGVDAKTVASYIDILEQAFVVFRLPSFSRNLRNEIKSNRKIYFYDNGVRNAVISALQPLAARKDVGALWENFLMSERLKRLSYEKDYASSYFWRTKQQQEIDYLEEKDGVITGFEFKWNPKKKARIPKTFTTTYNANVATISRENFRDFVM